MPRSIIAAGAGMVEIGEVRAARQAHRDVNKFIQHIGHREWGVCSESNILFG